MQCMLQWIAKPSWHKVNHQNCAAACQSPSCVMCAVPFTTTFSRACMLCKWYHASSSGICHAGSYQRVSDSRPLFRHQVKVDASTGFSSSLPKSYKPDRSRRENGRTMMLTEHLQRFGNWTWHPKFLPKSVNCTLQWIGIWLGKIYQLDKTRSLARICACWRCAHPIAATRHSPQNPTICGTHVIQTY